MTFYFQIRRWIWESRTTKEANEIFGFDNWLKVLRSLKHPLEQIQYCANLLWVFPQEEIQK